MPLVAILLILIILFSIVIHEVAHGVMADRLGDPTARYAGRLTLNPIPHLDPIGSVLVPIWTYLTFGAGFGWAKPVPYNPYNIRARYGDALVAAAGPLSNIILALIGALLLKLVGPTGLAASVLDAVITVNLVLAVFNLIPVPPLDGSKIIAEFLPYGIRERFLNVGTMGLILMLVVLFVVWPLILPLVDALKGILV